MNKIFIPHELKTIEVDTEKKDFPYQRREFRRWMYRFYDFLHTGRFPD